MRIPYTTIIDRTGLYLTRGGLQVRIDTITPGSSFPCKGTVYRRTKTGRLRRQFSTWAFDGRNKALAGSRLDVVAYVGA